MFRSQLHKWKHISCHIFGYSNKINRCQGSRALVLYCSSVSNVSGVSARQWTLGGETPALLDIWYNVRCLSELTLSITFWMYFSEFAEVAAPTFLVIFHRVMSALECVTPTMKLSYKALLCVHTQCSSLCVSPLHTHQICSMSLLNL